VRRALEHGLADSTSPMRHRCNSRSRPSSKAPTTRAREQ
jgi:hypothetical protein